MENTPRELGFRMPAEWEKQSAVWLQWPYEIPIYSSEQKAGDKTFQMKLEKTWLFQTSMTKGPYLPRNLFRNIMNIIIWLICIKRINDNVMLNSAIT